MGTNTTTKTDRYGFPLKPCTRCGGGGAFGPTSVHGGACFGCGGTGWQVATKRASQARTAMLTEMQRQHSINTMDLAEGEQIAYQGKWRTIEAIELGRVTGRQTLPVEKVVSRETTITLDGGEVVAWPSNVAHRRGGVNVADYLAMAGVR